jgi:taurine dioxygenase
MVTIVQPDVSITRCGGALGARVEGVDLAQPIDEQTMALLREAFATHCVLVFPGQGHLTPPQHAAFGERWGQHFAMPPPARFSDEHETVLLVHSGPTAAPRQPDQWHTDVSCVEQPPSASLLLARLLPPAGGDTQWANQYLAYESLSEAMRRMLLGLRAVHVGLGFAALAGLDPSEAATAVHPVVRTHPVTGHRALFVNERFTTQFEGMTVEESTPLLRWLYAHSTQPNFTYRHHWSVGDLVMWDNRCVQHFVVRDYVEERMMHRVTLTGERPT